MAAFLIAFALFSFAPGNFGASNSALRTQDTSTIAADKKKAADEDDIREAVFRYQFDHDGASVHKPASVYYLSLGGVLKGQLLDVSDEFLKRFKEHKPPVRKVSQAKVHAMAGVIDKETGEKGLVFEVWTITWLSEDEAEVGGSYYENGLSASGVSHSVKRQGGKWVVTSAKGLWIS